MRSSTPILASSRTALQDSMESRSDAGAPAILAEANRRRGAGAEIPEVSRSSGVTDERPHETLMSSFKRKRQRSKRQAARSQSISIFVSTFNMGEQNVSESELVEWIPSGHEVYVIGVQECMNLGDLQAAITRHLTTTTSQKYVFFSREIGKRATALGYHGYIALTVFVLEEAIHEGRFEMPRPQSMTKHAQEVYRGKSLLFFGRASNKGAVGLSFRYGNTSFAFVTCHLASDSSTSLGAKKRSFRANTGPSSSVAFDDTNSHIGDVSISTTPSTAPPSKLARRNQDAMEILQQLHLDEEDYGFGFPLLHHHSFVLGDLNYRMTRKGSTPSQMLELLHGVCVGASHMKTHNCASANPGFYEALSTPVSTSTIRLSPDLPTGLKELIEEHDELTNLRETGQVFAGFKEPPISFFPDISSSARPTIAEL
ncbi:hypothetical protein PINS_up022482 [Pythium insidiosum]|nr:hypothetical protein PINS_up022482 [Pythium insidiosum]